MHVVCPASKDTSLHSMIHKAAYMLILQLDHPACQVCSKVMQQGALHCMQCQVQA